MFALLAHSLLANAAPAYDAPVVAPGLSPDSPAWLQLAVKFADDAQVRATGSRIERRDVAAVAQAHGLSFRHAVPAAPWVEALQERAAERSGRSQPDLAGLFYVDGPADPATIEAAGEALRALSVVDAAWVEVQGLRPPGLDIDPATPDYTAEQGWLAPDPGLGFTTAWAAGYTGAGIRVSNAEYAFTASHEDLPVIGVEPGQTPSDPWGPDHGTATFGEVLAEDNGFGMTGGAHGATGAFYTEYSDEEGWRRATAITAACADSAPGDIVMLEMQAFGVSNYAPAEYELGVWLVTRSCVDAGVLVIAAAGNGDQDLDSPGYAEYRDRGDSGGILVGAGSGGWDGLHNREWFSTYGSRVDVQAWGGAVATLAYGDLARVGGDSNQAYTAVFSGTSSATPMVVAAAAVLQECAVDRSGERLPPEAMRELLQSTGVPQGAATAGTPIGPLPSIEAALDALSDPDGDGHFGFWDDCDETRPSVHAGALEVPSNGIDDNCDGEVDELAGWTDLGGGLAGDFMPTLVVSGEGTLGSSFTVTVDGLPAGGDMLMLAGQERADTPMFGGTVIPRWAFAGNLGPADGDGHFEITLPLPRVVDLGESVYLQGWVRDEGGPAGFAATNGYGLTLAE